MYMKEFTFIHAMVCKSAACSRAMRFRGLGADQNQRATLCQHSHNFSFARRLSFATHYLNAWNRLPITLTPGTGYPLSESVKQASEFVT